MVTLVVEGLLVLLADEIKNMRIFSKCTPLVKTIALFEEIGKTRIYGLSYLWRNTIIHNFSLPKTMCIISLFPTR